MTAVIPLARHLHRPIVVLDVGCRGGLSQPWLALRPHATVIGFDADPEACERLQRAHRGDSSIRVEPIALGDANGRAVLHRTRDPACSSLYAPDEELIERRAGLDLIAPVGEVEVGLMRLDDWLERNEGIGGVDAIKIDVQGAELDVLIGASVALGDIRAIEIEVQFNPLYQGVPLFADVDRYLRSNGFELWRLEHLAHYGATGGEDQTTVADFQSSESSSVSFEAPEGQLYWADAFYLRKDMTHGAATDWQDGVIDACLTGTLGFFDIAASALRRASETAPPAVAAEIAALVAD